MQGVLRAICNVLFLILSQVETTLLHTPSCRQWQKSKFPTQRCRTQPRPNVAQPLH